MPVPAKDDLLIRHIANENFELVDISSGRLLASTPSLSAVLELASARDSAVWRVDADNHGNALGEPVQWLAPRSNRAPKTPAA